MSDLVGNLEDRFSCVVAHMIHVKMYQLMDIATLAINLTIVRNILHCLMFAILEY